MARAKPVCAIMASRLACGFVNSASVTTTASVVFSTDVAAAPPLMRMASISGVNDGGNPRPPYSPPISNGAAQNHGPSPTVMLPAALTTASAATRMPLRVAAGAPRRCRAEPALEIRGGGAETGADAAECEIGGGRGGRGIAELAVG